MAESADMAGLSDFAGYRYFDYAATSPLCEEAAEVLRAYAAAGPEGLDWNANANSLHSAGRAAFKKMEAARKRMAAALGARRPDEVVFTGGATESDNAAVVGIARGVCEARRKKGHPVENPRVITSAIEHEAVAQPMRFLRELGFEVVTLPVDRAGFVCVADLEQALTPDTVLVSVMTANSEVGSIQPIAQLCEAAHRAGAYFHTDAVQALGKIEVPLQEWGVDAASFSAHKIGGPKGIGVLYLKSRTPFEPYMLGGGQELGRRSGTQNVMGMEAFAAAAECAASLRVGEYERLSALKARLLERLSGDARISPSVSDPLSDVYLPNIVHVLVEGIESQTLILRLDKRGFCVSGGSACSSNSLETSHVLRSMGISDKAAQGALRMSMGRWTTEEDVDLLAEALFDVIG